MFRKLTFVFICLLLALNAGTAIAQSPLERAFVAKSQLAGEIWTEHDPSSTAEVNHDSWDQFLAKYVVADASGINRFAYGSVSADDLNALDDYLSRMQALDVTVLNRNEQFAYWLNLYNATTVRVVLKHYPVKSILDIKSNLLDFKGPFNDRVVKVKGHDLTLDTIESGIVRPIWNDPRLHYAFNCGAISCPNLNTTAYRGNTIDAQLNAAAIAFINDPRGVQVKGGEIIVSKIFFWYREDFGGDEEAVLRHIETYAAPGLKIKLAGRTRISAYQYDWALNGR